MPCPLLPSGHEREDTRGDAFQRSEDDVLSPIGGVAIYLVKIKAPDVLLFLTILLTYNMKKILLLLVVLFGTQLFAQEGTISRFKLIQNKNTGGTCPQLKY